MFAKSEGKDSKNPEWLSEVTNTVSKAFESAVDCKFLQSS